MGGIRLQLLAQEYPWMTYLSSPAILDVSEVHAIYSDYNKLEYTKYS